MQFDEAAGSELQKNFHLLCALISPDKAAPKADLSRTEDIIRKEIPAALGKSAPPNYCELCTGFQAEYDRFRDYILYEELTGKNVAVLGGGFSSGKSSFLNALNGEPTLPEAAGAVPIYVVHGSRPCVQAINIFGAKVTFPDLQDIRKITSGFGNLEQNGRAVSGGIGHMLESVCLATPRQAYENIAFLDAPSCLGPDAEQYSDYTGERIAHRRMNAAGLLLWFVSAETGGMPKNDIDFLKSLREEIPKLVIFTRAGQRAGQLERMMDRAREDIALNGVHNCQGVYAYDKECPEKYDMEKIRAFLSDWNWHREEPRFAVNFKKLFVRCRKYFEDEQQKTGWRLSQLSRAGGGNEAGEAVSRVMQALREEDAALAAAGEAVQALQDEFFQELARIGDVVGIYMPDSDEIDRLQENTNAPLELLKAYNQSKGISRNEQLRDILRETFQDVRPVLGRMMGGSQYRKRLAEVLKENCQVAPDQIRLNDVYKNADNYTVILQSLKRDIHEDAGTVMMQMMGGSRYQSRLTEILRGNCPAALEQVRFNNIYRNAAAYQAVMQSLEQDACGDIGPMMIRMMGGSQYQSRLTEILWENCRIALEQMQFNKIYKNADAYQAVMQSLKM